MRCLDDTICSMDMSLSKLWKMVKDRETWRAADHGVAESDMTERLNNNVFVWQIHFAVYLKLNWHNTIILIKTKSNKNLKKKDRSHELLKVTVLQYYHIL